MATAAKKITITVHTNGDIDVVPALAHVKQGTTVMWEVKADKGLVIQYFALLFDSTAAFEKRVIDDAGNKEHSNDETAQGVGEYHYEIVVGVDKKGKDGAGRRIFTDVYCPTIIIR